MQYPPWMMAILADERQHRYRAEARRAHNQDLRHGGNHHHGPTAGAGVLHREVRAFLTVCRATAGSYVRRRLAYAIDVVRLPLYPLMYFATLLLTYRISGRDVVDGVGVEGFLLVGVLGIILWQSNLWASGYAIETERREGTLPSLLLTPASRGAVVVGYALGSIAIEILPAALVLAPVAWLAGVRFDVQDPFAVALATLSLAAITVALGYGLAGIFVLTRRANLLANFLQAPIYLLTGMVVPVESLPGPMRWLADVFPISFGITALRQSALEGASLDAVSGYLLRLAGAMAIVLVIGTLFLRRVEHVAKRSADLDLQ